MGLFIVIIIFGGVSGGHFNPAYTLSVFVREKNYGRNAPFMLMIMASQCIGAVLGMIVAVYSVRYPVNGQWTVPLKAPLLLPSTTTAQVVAG